MTFDEQDQYADNLRQYADTLQNIIQLDPSIHLYTAEEQALPYELTRTTLKA